MLMLYLYSIFYNKCAGNIIDFPSRISWISMSRLTNLVIRKHPRKIGMDGGQQRKIIYKQGEII